MTDPQINIKIAANSDGVAAALDQATEHIERAQQAAELAGDVLGVKIPAALQEILAESELVGPALEAAFPILVALDFAATIGSLIGKIADAGKEAEIFRQNWIKIGADQEDIAVNTEDAIDRQKQKYIELTQGPLAALEYELSHMRSIALSVFRDIESEMNRAATEFTREGGWFGIAAVSKAAGEDVKKTLADMDKAMHDSALAHPKDLMAPFLAEQQILQGAIASTNNLIARRSAAMGADKSLVEPLQRELALYQQINQEIERQKSLQSAVKSTTEARAASAVAKATAIHVVDVTRLAEAHGRVVALLRKEKEEAENANVQAAKALNSYYRDQARQRLEIEETVDTGAIQLAHANERATEAVLERDLAQHKITKGQEVLAVREAKLKELAEEEFYFKAIRDLYPQGTKEWQEYQNRLNVLHAEAVKVRAKAATDEANNEDQQWRKVLKGMQSAFSNFTQDIVSGHQTILESWLHLVNGMVSKFIEGLERQLVQFLSTEAAKDAASATSHAKEGIRTAATAAQHAYDWATAWGGPVAGAISAAIAFSGVTAFSSAEGGQWEVPGIQPTILHPREMVLPAAIAGKMRNMVENGSATGAGLAVHFHVHAVDGQDGAAFIQRRMGQITDNLVKHLKKKGISLR